jgi:hypothetical protein
MKVAWSTLHGSAALAGILLGLTLPVHGSAMDLTPEAGAVITPWADLAVGAGSLFGGADGRIEIARVRTAGGAMHPESYWITEPPAIFWLVEETVRAQGRAPLRRWVDSRQCPAVVAALERLSALVVRKSAVRDEAGGADPAAFPFGDVVVEGHDASKTRALQAAIDPLGACWSEKTPLLTP